MDANRSLLVRHCVRPEASHPCDVVSCDPLKEVEGECPKPYICAERVKNPALPHENSKYKSIWLLEAVTTLNNQQPIRT